MPYRLVVDADLVKSYQLQHLRRIKIAEGVVASLGWREGDIIFELVDREKKVVILVKGEDFGKLLGNGNIEVREGSG